MHASSPSGRAYGPAPWHLPLAVLLAGALACWLWPGHLGLFTRLFITALLVLSLDLMVGVAGLATLGHAALFGTGAYAAGLLALHLTGQPLAGLAAGAGAAALLALLSGLFLLRYQGFTFLMLTIAVAQIVLSLAQKARDWTGGDDGLSGYGVGPLPGGLDFDLEGRVAAGYTLALLVAALWVCGRWLVSPHGLSVQGIHQNRARMAALGTPVRRRLLAVMTASGALAGVAGAASAQVNAVVGLDTLGFGLSAEVLVMLVLGGAGRLRGAVVGATVFTVLHHSAAAFNPYHWMFAIGMVLMAVVLLPPERWGPWLRQRLAAMWPGGHRHPVPAPPETGASA